MDQSKIKKILYFGIYKPTAPRDKIYLDGLKKLGIEIIECVDNTSGFKKFINLYKKHSKLKGQYDLFWIGYSSGILSVLARFISQKKIVYNALNSMYESYVLDRERPAKGSLGSFVIWFGDFLAFHFAHISLVESEEQKKFISNFFLVNPKRLFVVYTGADEDVFYPDPNIKKNDTFTVCFRGMFLPATGVEYVIEAARILKDEDINFLVIGWGEPIEEWVKNKIKEYDLTKLTLITVFLSVDDLRQKMLSSDVILGQFCANERMDRTIQHKTFEAMALGMPYITRDSRSNREILTDRENCLFVKVEDPQDIADKILELKNNKDLREKIASNAYKLYQEKLTQKVLVNKIIKCL
ncbi:MAG: glycosyltransferase family 4 protein [Candidatus Paceibacterota bacterium]